MKQTGFAKIIQLIATVAFCATLVSCVPESSNGSRKKEAAPTTQGGTTTPESPTYANDLNFFQSAGVSSTSAFDTNLDFNDSIYLRGKQVDTYIKNGNQNTAQCLSFAFTDSTLKKILVIQAQPRNFFNYGTNQKEYYFLLSPSTESENRVNCQTTGLINNLSLNYPGYTIVYDFVKTCDTCNNSLLTSSDTKIFTPAGNTISEVSVSALFFRIFNSTGTGGSTTPGTQTCTENSQCTSLGYDCCVSNQCINNKTLKSGVDQSSAEFIQALSDINANPSMIYNYPQFYNLCSTLVTPTPTPPATTDPEEEARQRFIKLKELYDCTTPIEGEMSHCTLNFTDADPGDYYTNGDDRNFSTTHTTATSQLPLADHSIVSITHAGELIYGGTNDNPAHVTIGPGNDDMFNKNKITLNHVKADSADNNDLKITYKIDGSCEKVNSLMAKCYKVFTQGEGRKLNVTGEYGKVTDHYPGSNKFELPLYANTGNTIKVEVDSTERLQGTHWNLVAASPPYIQFHGSDVQVFDNQKVKITYFVDTATHNVLQQKQTAIESIATICKCPDLSCRIEPVETVINGTAQITDYQCSYKDTTAPAPLQQTVYLNAKTVPVRYYDINGAPHAEAKIGVDEQEGLAFEYTKNNKLKPNNVSSYVGFNEIYGSLSIDVGSASAAKEVQVEINRTYDIYVTQGAFSSCELCGTDYYSNMAKIFPKNFLHGGAGFLPHASLADKTATQEYRGDDLIFGRACFLPATMIPWGHRADTMRIDQRRNRLATQHFLFANGYQRDWFGFDYGSVIGSFDGVTWFSIGTNRRIQAKGNKLFLAINAYFGDLTVDSNFTVMVSDSSTSAVGSGATTDFASDGAQCQAYHECDTDNDCASRLGWDYVCAKVTSLQSPWPEYDSNGLEIPNSSILKNILQLNGSSAGQPNRCVYRGKGAPCNPSLTVADASQSYNKTDETKLLGCSANNYCQPFIQTGNVSRFNDRIARYGKSVKAQNASIDVAESDLDTFGLGARFIGRPYDFIGKNEAPQQAISNLNTNQIDGICVPGRDPSNATLTAQNTRTPSSNHLADQVNGQGVTATGNTASAEYLSSCANFDDQGNYVHLNPALLATSLSDTTINIYAGAQSISTNSLDVFQTLSGSTLNFIKSFEDEFIDEMTLQKNRCLRAPGTSCHTNLDCAPSSYITDKVKNLDPNSFGLGWGANGSGLNPYEVRFWQETLVCSQETLPTADDYDVKNNRCCRQMGNTITIPTSILRTTSPDFKVDVSDGKPAFSADKVPGIDLDLNDPTRYSRVATIYHDLKKPGSTVKLLEAADDNSCGAACKTKSDLNKQYETINLYAQRTCCTGNWVRNFHSTNQSGGHTWGPSKMQNVEKSNFRCMNWSPSPAGQSDFTCASTADPYDVECNMRATPSTEGEKIFDWLGTMELLGVPQIAVKSVDFSETNCKVDPSNSSIAPGAAITIPGLVSDGATAEYSDGSGQYYSAIDSTNFNSDMKMIFSEDELSCCLPLDTQMDAGADPNLCCSGHISPATNKCALPNYSNLSVYFNRYISSEGNGISPSLIDEKTGYIKSASIVQTLACQVNACESGVIGTGIALTDLKFKGHENDAKMITRFIDGDDLSNNFNGKADLFNDGMRWNTHVYCVPTDAAANSDVLNIIDCNAQ